MSIRKFSLNSILVAVALVVAVATSNSVVALEFEVVMEPKVIIVNGIPTVRMIPRLRAIPLPPGILPGLQIVNEKIWDEAAVRKVLPYICLWWSRN